MATKYPAPNPPMIPARRQGGRQAPRALVIHGTVSSDNPGTARQIAKWWAGPNSPMSSCHYTVDPKEVIQSVGDHRVAFHCGSNQDCIGIELCDEQAGPASRWRDQDSQAIIRRAARLAAELCLAYDIEPRRPSIADLRRKGKHGIYGHNDSRLAFGGTTHTDPKDFPWDQFLKLVRQEIALIKEPAVTIRYPDLPPADLAFWNMNNGARPGVRQALDAIEASGARVTALNEVSGHWPVVNDWAKDNGFSVVRGEGDLASASGLLIRHRSGHIASGFRTINETWVGPQGKKIAGRTIFFEKSVIRGRKIMIIDVHQVWGPNRPTNDNAKHEVGQAILDWIEKNPDWEIFIGPDWNESATSTVSFSPLRIAQKYGGRILKTGEAVDFIVYIPRRSHVPGEPRPSSPRARATAKMGSDHKVVLVDL